MSRGWEQAPFANTIRGSTNPPDLGLVNLISRCWEVVPISWLEEVSSKC
jgi:hypothetical protein